MNVSTAFPEKGEPFRERSPQHSVSTKGLGPCASQPEGPFYSKTALDATTFLITIDPAGGTRVLLRRGGWCPVHDHIRVNVFDRRCKGLVLGLGSRRSWQQISPRLYDR